MEGAVEGAGEARAETGPRRNFRGILSLVCIFGIGLRKGPSTPRPTPSSFPRFLRSFAGRSFAASFVPPIDCSLSSSAPLERKKRRGPGWTGREKRKEGASEEAEGGGRDARHDHLGRARFSRVEQERGRFRRRLVRFRGAGITRSSKSRSIPAPLLLLYERS